MRHGKAARWGGLALAAIAAWLGAASAETRTLGSMSFEAPDGWSAKPVTTGIILQKEFRDPESGAKGAAMIQVLGPFNDPPDRLDANFDTAAQLVKAFAEEDPMLRSQGVTTNGHRIRTDYRCCARIGDLSAGQRTVGIAAPQAQAFFTLVQLELEDEADDETEAAFAALVRSARLVPSDKPFDLAPREGDGGLDGVFTHLDTGIRPNAFGGTDFYSESEITVFDPSGLFSTELPEGGDIQAHCRAEPTDCGLYKVTGGGFFGGERRIEMREVADDFGTLEGEAKPLKSVGDDIEIDGTLQARVPPPPAGTPFEGTWRYFFASAGSMATSSGSIAVERFLTLSRDGTFQRNGFSGASSTSDAGGSTVGFTTGGQRPATSGRYRVDGYALELTGSDGKVERLSLFLPEADSDALLVIGGSNYLKEDGSGEAVRPNSGGTASTPKRPRS
jgi:hypothetical protein